jgi:Raf kinase inhibitor-like YbhB/YbcL family protein
MEGKKRVLILLGVIGTLEVAALCVLLFYPSPKAQKGPGIIGNHPNTMELSSSAFSNNGSIPSKYTCDGEGMSPPITWARVPAEAKSLALIVDDPDVPKQIKADGVFDHWVLYNIPTTTSEIPEGTFAGDQGKNGTGQIGYTGPCPPKDYEPTEHRYVFVLYALDTDLAITDPTKDELLKAMEGHIVEQAQLVGKYQKQ